LLEWSAYRISVLRHAECRLWARRVQPTKWAPDCCPCMKAPLRVKRFFRFCLTFLHHSHLPSDTLRLSGAEDKALRGRNLSADSGARPEPAGNTSRWFLFHLH